MFYKTILIYLISFIVAFECSIQEENSLSIPNHKWKGPVISRQEEINMSKNVKNPVKNKSPCKYKQGKGHCLSIEQILNRCYELERVFLPNLTWYLAAWTDSDDISSLIDNVEFAEIFEARNLPFEININCTDDCKEGFFLRYQLNATYRVDFWIRSTIEEVNNLDTNIWIRNDFGYNTESFECFADQCLNIPIETGFFVNVRTVNNIPYVLEFHYPKADVYLMMFFLEATNYYQKEMLANETLKVNPMNLSDFPDLAIKTKLINDQCSQLRL